MPRAFRLFVTCLLALTLPWQGVAAATLLWCGGSPMAALSQPVAADLQQQPHRHTHPHPHPPPQPEPHRHINGHMNGHLDGHLNGHMGSQHAEAQADHTLAQAPAHAHDATPAAAHAPAETDAHPVAQADLPQEQGGHGHAGHGCTTCAACCAAAAGPVLPLVIASQGPTASALARPPQAGVPAFVTDGPERPPRCLV